MTFVEMLKEAQKKQESLVCVGLDPELSKFPKPLLEENRLLPDNPPLEHLLANYPTTVTHIIFSFNQRIVDATAPYVSAFKPQYAFYGAYRQGGLEALKKTIDYIHEKYPGIPVILDAKRNDIGNTAKMYAQEMFDFWGVDAFTANPYMGLDTLEPFFEKGKGVIVLCKTSNEGSGDFQDLIVNDDGMERPLYLRVARLVKEKWGATGNLGLVVGATYPEQLGEIRDLVGFDIPLLIPGIGAQKGDLQGTLEYNKGGLAIINSGRGVIYASSGEDFAEKAGEAAKKLQCEINVLRGVKST